MTKKVGRLVFKPTKIIWGTERMSFVVYKNKDKYLVNIKEKLVDLKKLHDWGIHKWGLVDMMKIISDKGKRRGRITINTLPKEVMERANKELILDRLK